MTQKYLYSLRDFSLGVNEKDAPNLIPDNALIEAQNAILGRGFVSKRHGFTKYNTTPLDSGVTALYHFNRNDGIREFIVSSGRKLYKDNNGIMSQIPFNGITTLTESKNKFLTYKDRSANDALLIADRGKLKVYNGTDIKEVSPYSPSTEEQTNPGSNTLSTLTSFRAIAIKKDRIFAAADSKVKNRVSFCHHDPGIGFAVYDYWPATFFFDVAAGENDEIVELKVFRDALIIFCKRSIWALYGDGMTLNDYNLHKINVPSGVVSQESVKEVGNNIFFLSDDHVYSLFATDQNYISAEIVSTAKETGSSVDNTLKTIPLMDKAKAVGAYFDNKYYLSFPSGITLVYDNVLKAWVKWTQIQANTFLDIDGVLYFGSIDGHVHRFSETVFNDDGRAIPFKIKTKILDFGKEVQDKKFRRLWLITKQYDGAFSTVSFQAFIDFNFVELKGIDTDIETNTGAIWDETDWNDGIWDYQEVVQKELRIKVRGKSIQITLSNGIIDQPLTIYGVVFEYKLKKP